MTSLRYLSHQKSYRRSLPEPHSAIFSQPTSSDQLLAINFHFSSTIRISNPFSCKKRRWEERLAPNKSMVSAVVKMKNLRRLKPIIKEPQRKTHQRSLLIHNSQRLIQLKLRLLLQQLVEKKLLARSQKRWVLTSEQFQRKRIKSLDQIPQERKETQVPQKNRKLLLKPLDQPLPKKQKPLLKKSQKIILPQRWNKMKVVRNRKKQSPRLPFQPLNNQLERKTKRSSLYQRRKKR